MATKGKKNLISVDFSDVEASGTPDEGDYVLRVDEVEQKVSEKSGGEYLAITFKITEGKFKGKTVWHNCSLQPQALFNLRGLLEALGFDVTGGKFEFDPADMIGESCGASLAHETYNGKVKARPVEFFSPDEVGGSSVEVSKPEPVKPPVEEVAKTSKKKAKKEGFVVGDKVSFIDDEGNDLEGVLISLEDGAYTVKTGEGKKTEEWELEESDLTKV